MEINQFVSDSISQIAFGIKDAISKNSSCDMIVNPQIIVGSGDDMYIPDDTTKYHIERRVSVVHIDMAVVVTESDDNSVGGKIGVASFGFHLSNDTGTSSTMTNRISFSIPIAFPFSK